MWSEDGKILFYHENDINWDRVHTNCTNILGGDAVQYIIGEFYNYADQDKNLIDTLIAAAMRKLCEVEG